MWACDTATFRWLPPEDWGIRPTVAHFKKEGPAYDDALSWLRGVPESGELDGCDGLRVGREAVADDTLIALLHQGTADRCRWDALVPHLTGRHT